MGSQLLRELLAAEGLLIKNHVDCGCILFDANEQSVKSGAPAGVLRGGAVRAHPAAPAPGQPEAGAVHSHRGLMSQTTFLQKETIPAVAHLVELRAPEKEK